MIGWCFAEAKVDSTAYRCQAILSASQAGPNEQHLFDEPGWLSSFFRGKLSERRQQIEHNHKVSEDRKTLSAKKEAARSEVEGARTSTLAKEIKTEHLAAGLQELAKLIYNDIEGAKTIEEVEIYRAHFSQTLKATIALSRQILGAIEPHQANLERIYLSAPKGFARKEFRSEVERMKQVMNRAETMEEVTALANHSEGILRRWIAEFGEQEKTRALNEKRFNVKVEGNSEQIFTSLVDVLKAVDPTISETFSNRFGSMLAALMESNAALKNFVYREMQFFRLLTTKTKLSKDKATIERVNNDMKILSAAIQGDASAASRTQTLKLASGMRKALRLLNKPGVFSKLLPKDSMRRLTAEQREGILADALDIPELAVTIMNAAVVLPPLGSAPVKPIKPTKPVKPNFKAILKSSRRSAKARYEAAKSFYESQKIRFQTDMVEYAAEKARFLVRRDSLKAMDGRRLMARGALVSYLANRFPDVLAGPKDAGTGRNLISSLVNQRNKEALRRRMSRMPSERINRLESERQRLRDRYHDSYDDSWDWFMLMYTGNPMWLVSPEIARFQLYVDLLSHHDHHHLHHELGEGMPYHEIFRDGLSAVERYKEAQENVDRYLGTNPEIRSELDDQRAKIVEDADLGLGGMTVKDAVKHAVEKGWDLESRVDELVDREFNDRSQEANVEMGVREDDPGRNRERSLDEEWNDFQKDSDSDWAKSKQEDIESETEVIEETGEEAGS